MDDFFRNVPVAAAAEIEDAARLIFELREDRNTILLSHAASDEAELLARIADGGLPEHPTYESYLSARIVAETREALRRQLAAHLSVNNGLAGGAADGAGFAFGTFALKAQLEARHRAEIDGDVVATRDAVLFKLVNGIIVELRVLSPDEYAFGWLFGDASLRIDTAPLSAGQTAASHCHDCEGQRRADPVTRVGEPPLENIERLIRALLADPLLGYGSAA